MKKNLFEMGAKFEDGWSSDNRQKSKKQTNTETKAPNKHSLTIAKEKRRGKIVIIIKEFFISKSELKSLLTDIKKHLGCGGTIKNNSIELQGNLSKEAKDYLIQKNFTFK